MRTRRTTITPADPSIMAGTARQPRMHPSRHMDLSPYEFVAVRRVSGYEFDPANAVISGPFPAALNAYVRTELKYKNDTPYAVSGDVRPWSYGNVENQYLNTAETLRGAMAANQFLKVFVANGYYDGATPFFATEYTFFQTDLAGDLKDRVKMGYYEAGHMMYIHKPSHANLKADLAEFIRDAAGIK